jgi:hypothetical protein
MEYGVWSMEHGAWSMEHGVWSVFSGRANILASLQFGHNPSDNQQINTILCTDVGLNKYNKKSMHVCSLKWFPGKNYHNTVNYMIVHEQQGVNNVLTVIWRTDLTAV